MATKHLNQIDLAARWNISHRTLERWRWTGEGPRFVKLGGRVVYRLEDVEDYEREQIRASTTDNAERAAASGARPQPPQVAYPPPAQPLPLGCICPPTSEKTCQSPMCPRRSPVQESLPSRNVVL
jgi:hypothetical protein